MDAAMVWIFVFHRNVYVEILIPKIVETFGKSLVHEEGGHENEISVLIKRPQKTPLLLPQFEDTVRR